MSTKLRIAGRKEINWPTTIVLSVFHVGAVAALFVFTWSGSGP
jgi:hypothetical protein